MTEYSNKRLLIIGYGAAHEIGAHFVRAAHTLGLETHLLDNQPAFAASWIWRQFNWRIRGHRPPNLATFSHKAVRYCQTFQPHYLLVTGMMAIQADTLYRIRQQGIKCFNFLTDDPWNQSHGSSWFRASLPQYDMVFSPRQSNLADLEALGCRVMYLPFGYEPTLHYPEQAPSNREAEYACDVMFYGGADKDRLPYIKSILQAGYKLHLYGSYWNRDAITQPAWRGFANPQTLRWAVTCAKVNLCLVRRSNRDGHVMRTFEVPAMRGCMLVEDTLEHRQILGDEQTVVYFQHIGDMLDKLPKLLEDEIYRNQLAVNAHQHIISGKNRYADRLQTMLDSV
jgi:spore maturation protein CgeB